MSLGDYLGVFLLGLAGTGHCVGMCGGFSLAVGAGANGAAQVVGRQAVYQFGKSTSYLLLGVVLLLTGSLTTGIVPASLVQKALGVVAGALMIVLGLAYLSEWRGPVWLGRWLGGSPLCAALGGAGASPVRSLAIGWLNGLIPCGLSFAVLVHLVSFGSVAALAGGVYVFGLGTLPGLLAVAWLGRRWSVSRRRWLVRGGGAALVVFGMLTLVRGNPALHHWMHGHAMPADPPAAGAPAQCH